MGFFAFVCCFLTRVNLSMALLKMVNTTYVHEVESKGANASHKTSACFGADNVTNDKKVCVIRKEVLCSIFC